MQVEILAFGIAKDILGNRQLSLHLSAASTIADLRAQLTETYPTFEKLKSLRFAVGEEYVEDEVPLKENDQVVIIPPVSGG